MIKFVLDIHTHTIASGHAFNTLHENAVAASEKGLELIAATDHGPAMTGAPTEIFFAAETMIQPVIAGVKIMRGAEANIVNYDGKLDISDKSLGNLDFVIAALHDIVIEPCGKIARNTDAVIKAIANPLVDVIAHPGNPVFQIDIPAVVSAAKEYGKLLEINNNSINVRPGSVDNCKEIARICAEEGIPVVCGSDAHIDAAVGDFTNSNKLLRAVNFPKESVINTSVNKLLEHLRKTRQRKFDEDGRWNDQKTGGC
jgi:putative hydrolase